MTEIEKVSIGGYAFTLEKAAAEEVGQYLKNLACWNAADGAGWPRWPTSRA